MTEDTPIEAQRLIANFMTASAPLERYLQEGRPLSSLQLDSIVTTLGGLQTFIDVWKRKQGKAIGEEAR